MKIRFKIILSISMALCAALLSVVLSVKATASCRIDDNDYGYTLICEGETGSCKFIGPDGRSITCPGNKGDAIQNPTIDDMEP